MTITVSTDPIVFYASLAYQVPKAVITNKVQTAKKNRQTKKYERMIAKSQAHLDSIPVAHGYVHVYA